MRVVKCLPVAPLRDNSRNDLGNNTINVQQMYNKYGMWIRKHIHLLYTSIYVHTELAYNSGVYNNQKCNIA